jgi:WhiB family redox-sensing transcriptional regulator
MEGSRLLPELEWRERAACLTYPASLFFGEDEAEGPAESPVERRLREEKAKRVCATCSVLIECREYALKEKESYGIWGGLTELERKARQHGRAS